MDYHQNKRRRLASSTQGVTVRGASDGLLRGSSLDGDTQSVGSHYESNAHNSSIFKHQLDHLLGSVQPDYHRMSHIDETLRELKNVIESIPDHEAMSISDAERYMN